MTCVDPRCSPERFLGLGRLGMQSLLARSPCGVLGVYLLNLSCSAACRVAALSPRLTDDSIEAVCFRNICGHVAPLLPDIVGLDQLADFQDVMIIHHTGKLRVLFLSSLADEFLVCRLWRPLFRRCRVPRNAGHARTGASKAD